MLHIECICLKINHLLNYYQIVLYQIRRTWDVSVISVGQQNGERCVKKTILLTGIHSIKTFCLIFDPLVCTALVWKVHSKPGKCHRFDRTQMQECEYFACMKWEELSSIHFAAHLKTSTNGVTIDIVFIALVG